MFDGLCTGWRRRVIRLGYIDWFSVGDWLRHWNHIICIFHFAGVIVDASQTEITIDAMILWLSPTHGCRKSQRTAATIHPLQQAQMTILANDMRHPLTVLITDIESKIRQICVFVSSCDRLFSHRQIELATNVAKIVGRILTLTPITGHFCIIEVFVHRQTTWLHTVLKNVYNNDSSDIDACVMNCQSTSIVGWVPWSVSVIYQIIHFIFKWRTEFLVLTFLYIAFNLIFFPDCMYHCILNNDRRNIPFLSWTFDTKQQIHTQQRMVVIATNGLIDLIWAQQSIVDYYRLTRFVVV